MKTRTKLLASLVVASSFQFSAFALNGIPGIVNKIVGKQIEEYGQAYLAQKHATKEEECVDMSGNWAGKCSGLADEEVDVEIELTRTNCSDLSVNKESFSVGENGSATVSPFAGSFLSVAWSSRWQEDGSLVAQALTSIDLTDLPLPLNGRIASVLSKRSDSQLDIDATLGFWMGLDSVMEKKVSCQFQKVRK
ncbi:MAG: hypothetical protein A2504_13545 [Bdellovibrionales bacterium RIFOXYD12_FULL_39_22]|nr:MAG: hypothetical protein A2385_00270 [Bdellovibrionales bacterium RIFOXYB1_FULL_39_21]OFZ43888.1 MAG: hypothetical protein A2485_05260 [Bdellovibrionales bacterium RIFOXYC12_FULL_39_17]OFZ48778.1 MAG: hypothetical protein A2404_17585 [Bdellovibrionales bacterium RIFOXYC1_FULL_39_130]OFZ76511.1 MAG: hypothetical protein A2560_06250 [Bdellovibrionales bacterium RIFOXYD1_FULL_39_84]OFZ94745.1 MAG: hypothetical protein A2504_13545 [Bdellovibrionales bacterium RIFOXYD12_FULL_39_22]HLE12168.1 hy